MPYKKTSKLERIIADVASFYMGSMHDGRPMPDGGYDSRLIKLYEEETGERAIIDKVPTQAFKNWYNTKQVKLNGKVGRPPRSTAKLKQLIHRQLQHYSETGDRLYSLMEAQAEVNFAHQAFIKHSKIVIEQIFIDPEDANLIYDLIFGRITTSYQKKKEECLEKGLILRTTSKQWFDLLKNRGGETPSRLYIEVQCAYKEEHVNSVQIGHVMNCVDCRNEAYLNRPLTLTDILGLASERNIIAISFKDDSQQLTESEFNELVEAYEVQHQDSRDYKSKSTVYINLRWMCLDCNRIFERAYYLVKMAKVDRYCPSCVSSIDAQITLEKTGAAFQGYISQSFRSNEQLYKFLPERILLMDKYQVISHPNCHVDVYGVIFVAGKEFKIAIEHQGPQHYSLTAYINMARAQDIKRGIYKTNQQYEEDFNAQVERDKTKVELFEDLNKDGYYLIVVPYWVSPSERKDFILQEFITQTGVNPGQPSILDYL